MWLGSTGAHCHGSLVAPNHSEEEDMDLYSQLYEFSASVGAFEGYVYHKDKIDIRYLPNWSQNLRRAYELLPQEVRDSIQPHLDQTLGRAILSLSHVLGDEHEVIRTLKSMVKGALPSSPDDFKKRKWFQ